MAATREQASTPREQQLLVRTVQQEVELRALRQRVRMLEAKFRNSSPNRAAAATGDSPQQKNADGTTTTTTTTQSQPQDKNDNSNSNKPPGTKLMSPVVAEEIVPDTDGPVRMATHHHSAVVLGSSIYLYGGQHQPDARGFAPMEGDVWAFNLEKRAWRRVDVAGPGLRGRSRHSAVVYKGSMFVYGGTAHHHGAPFICNTLHTFSPASCRWFDVPLSPAGEALSDHTAVVVQDTMFIFGGINASGRNNIVRGIDLSQRTWLDAHTLNPQIGRTMSGVASPGGGDDDGSPGSVTSPVRGAIADVPAPRSGHTAVTWHNVVHGNYGTSVTASMVVFGGMLAPDACANDCFLYNYTTNMWSRLFCGGAVPEPRCDHTATCVREWMFICGGLAPGRSAGHNLGDNEDEEEEEEENDEGESSDGDGSSSNGSSRGGSSSSSSSNTSSEATGSSSKKKSNNNKKRRWAGPPGPPGPRLFSDVFALNLAASVWTKIQVTTLAPTILSQCGHASILYQSPEKYVAMLTFGGVTVVADDPAAIKVTNKKSSSSRKEHDDKEVEAQKSQQQSTSAAAAVVPLEQQLPDATLNSLLRHHRVVAAHHITAASQKKHHHHHRHHKRSSSETESEAAAAAAADDAADGKNSKKRHSKHSKDKKRKQQGSTGDEDDERERIVGGGIFVMRLISTRGERPQSASQDQQQQHQNQKHESLSRRRRGYDVLDDNNNATSSARPTSARSNRGGGGGGGGARPRSATDRDGGALPRWITTGSHVDLGPPKTSKQDDAGRPQQQQHARPGSAAAATTKRTDEEINRFFQGLNERTKEQMRRHEELRAKYLASPVEPARFASAEDEEASVARLYFESIQHQEQTKAELEEKFSPRNPSKIVQSAVIGEAIERLFAGGRPETPPRATGGGATAGGGGDSAAAAATTGGGGQKRGSSPPGKSGKDGGGKGDNDGKLKVKRITPQEEKDAVQRLYYLSLEFRKRREKELIDKHLYHGFKSPHRVDTAALVSRLYTPKEPPQK